MPAPRFTLQTGDALLVVDVQRDFLPGGALAVRHGDEVVEPLNRLIGLFQRHGLPIIATRDWHPPDHCSFHARGGPWPPHCIRDTPGAELAPRLRLPAGARVLDKAKDRDLECYSGFGDSGLEAELRNAGIRRVFVAGLTTDYCVLNTTLDARNLRLDVVVAIDATRAVDVVPGDGGRAFQRMKEAGATLATTAEIGA